MKTSAGHIVWFIILASALVVQPSTSLAQGTAFTYQGRLGAGGAPANGVYDLTFQLFSQSTSGAPVGAALTNASTSVSNGLFTTTLDFGSGVFDGNARWLEIGVRTNGGAGEFATLAPRQPVSVAPYAMRAANAAAAFVAGTATTAGTATVANSVSNDSIATSSLQNGAVTGAKIATGTVQSSNVNSASFSTTFWKADGNAGTTGGAHFIGTTDNQALELKVNNQRALRVEPNTKGAPNVLAGSPANSIAAGVVGATISGGGATNYSFEAHTNRVESDFAVIGGGSKNLIQIHSTNATIAGGYRNTIQTNAEYATISGGWANTISSNSYRSAIGGGLGNQIAASAASATISGGEGNIIGYTSELTVIGGGGYSRIGTNAYEAVIAGGYENSVSNYASRSVVSGGFGNTNIGPYAVIPGGQNNLAGTNSFAAGQRAKAAHRGSFVWADFNNADFATTQTNQFLIRASGGVGINTNNPQSALHVNGVITGTRFSGDGGGLTNLSAETLAGTLSDTLLSTNVALLSNTNVVFSGTVTASKFSGNGSALTGISTLDGPGGWPNDGLLVGSGGLVGIGTTNPIAGLQVTKSASISYPTVFLEVQDGTGEYTDLRGAQAVAVSSDNVLAIAAGTDNAVTLVKLPPGPNYYLATLRDDTGGFSNLAGACSVAFSSNNILAIAARNDNAVTLVSLTNPSAPVKLAEKKDGIGGWDDLSGANAVAFSGNLLAIAAPANRAVTLADVSNPSAPTIRSVLRNGQYGFDDLGWPVAVAFLGNLLAIADSASNAVTLVDVSNASSPVLKATLKERVNGYDYWFHGPRAVAFSQNSLLAVSAGVGYVTLVDVLNPTNPVLQKVLSGDLMGARGLAFRGSTLVVAAEDDNAVSWFDVSVPTAPRRITIAKNGIGEANFLQRVSAVASGWSYDVVAAWGDHAFTMFDLNTASAGIMSRGWVGIGTTNPIAALDVVGDVVVQGSSLDLNLSTIEIGYSSYAADGSVAIGNGSRAETASTAVGGSAKASPDSAAFGNYAEAKGTGSLAAGYSSVATGSYSTAIGHDTSATGFGATALGYKTQATGDYAMAAGAEGNIASGYGATVAGGRLNTNTAEHAVIGGGLKNRALDAFAGVNSGADNLSTGFGSVVSGGRFNVASNAHTVVGGGFFNQALANTSTIGGGDHNTINTGCDFAVIAGGIWNTIQETADRSTISGGDANTISTNADKATIGGGYSLNIRSNAALSTIGGGGWSGIGVNSQLATIAGGDNNQIGDNSSYSTIPGGRWNAVGNSSEYAFAAGRRAKANHTGAFVWADSTEADFASTANNQFLIRAAGGVGIGTGNPQSLLSVAKASSGGRGGELSIVNNGASAVGNEAALNFAVDSTSYDGDNGNAQIKARSMDAGNNASALIFSLWDGGSFGERMRIHNNGNVGIGNTNPTNKLMVVNASCNGSSWINASDRDLKQNFAPVDARAVLEKVASLPVQSWSYKAQPGETHLGPMAQDFHAAFGVGSDDKTIATVDADGVALAAIQGLNQVVKEKDAEIQALKKSVAELKEIVFRLSAREAQSK